MLIGTVNSLSARAARLNLQSLARDRLFGQGSIMQLTPRTLLLLLVLGAGLASACDDNSNLNTTTNPTPTTTETFTGTVTVNGAVTHVFSVTQRGTVKATLTAVGSDNTPTIGVSLGTW